MDRNEAVENIRTKWCSRLDDDGRWVTTEEGNHIHFNGEGEPDIGNKDIVASIKKKQESGKAAEKAVKNVSDCSSLSEASSLLNEKYGIEFESKLLKKPKNMDGSERNMMDMMRGIDSAMKEYPFMNGFIKQCKSRESKNGVMASYPENKTFNVTLEANRKKLYDDNYDKVIERQVERGDWPKNTTVGSMVHHEFGHSVIAYIISKKKDWSEEAKTRAWNTASLEKDIVSRAETEVTGKPYLSKKERDALYSSISNYAAVNRAETVAEAFEDCYANGDNAQPISKKIKELTLRMVDEVNKER